MAALTCMRWADALAAFEAAHQVLVEVGLRWYRARGLWRWAEVCLKRGEPGDRERAVELMRQSRDLFEELQVPYFARLVGEQLTSLTVLTPV